jgi:hypothetical protein
VARQFKVRYNDGRMQPVTADRWQSAGSNWIFTLDGREVAVISQKVVESITDDDIPDPARPAPRVGAV